MSIRVAVAERHAGVRRGLKELLTEAPGLVLVAEAASAGELLALCRAGAWDVALLNASPRDQSGPEALRALRQQCPGQGLIALTFALDFTFLQECLGAGAHALVAADDVVDEIVPAIRAVAAGTPYVSQAAHAVLAAGPASGQAP